MAHALKRIGIIVPSTNLTVEADFQRFLPAHVTAHAHRLWIPPGEMSERHLEVMNEGLADAARLLASANVDCIGYACTSGSFFKGREWDRQAADLITGIAEVPAFTTSQAVSAALSTFGARRISVATPYPEWTNRRLRTYFEGLGFDVLNVDSDVRAAAGGHRMINDQDPAEIFEFARLHCHGDADLMLFSCTAWRAFEIAGSLETALNRPVTTSNQATLWMALQTIGTATDNLDGAGSLFGKRHSPLAG